MLTGQNKIIINLKMIFERKLSWILVGAVTLYILLFLSLRWGQTRLIFHPDSLIKSTPQKHNLDYQDVWLDVEQDRVHGWWIPSLEAKAPVLLYFHGNGSNNGDLVDLALTFHKLGLSVLLIDYRGYGKSSQIFPNETRVYQDAAAAWQYLTKIRQINPKKIVVYGHSLGGAIAIELATKHPEMAGLITEGTFTSIKNMVIHDKLLSIFPLDWLITQHFDSITKIKSLQVPLLMFHGTEDEIIPILMAKKLYASAPQPKQLVIIPEANHSNLDLVGGQKYLLNLQQFIKSVTTDDLANRL